MVAVYAWQLASVRAQETQTNELLDMEIAAAAQGPGPDSTNGLGSWIWDAHTFDRQSCLLWRSFEVPTTTTVTHAQIRMTADNEYFLSLDGRELGRGVEWHELFDYNVTYLLSPGKHVIAVSAYNASDSAGMIFGLQIDLADGQTMEIKSDQNWRIVPSSEEGWKTKTKAPDTWPTATIVAPLGGSPWWTRPSRVNTMETLLPVKLRLWQTGWFQISSLSLCAATIFLSLRLIGKLAIHRRERWLLQRERARIARDIHDDLGSRMTQLVLHGEVAQSELASDCSTRLQIERICQEAREVLCTMDEILWELNPKRDTFRDFASYVCGYAQGFLKSTQIQCLFDVAPETSSIVLELPFRRALLMAVKETLNNAVKHSEATELILRIAHPGQKLVVTVCDNGKGFDRTRLKPGRNGLSNIVQRLEEVGGVCEVTSHPGQGCRTELSVSLDHRLRWNTWGWVLDKSQHSDQANKANPLEANYS
ncbi:MAG TPA: ATP-binding protein [Verrucomicrobiae bacterium]|jgi:signal transduction histidine kinase|nr:ATP-binding protein [Verrucomicrobiae bacterium]